MSPFGMVLPSASEIVRALVVAYVYVLLPALFLLSLILKIILRKLNRRLARNEILLRLFSSATFPILLIILLTIFEPETTSLLIRLLIVAFMTACVYGLHVATSFFFRWKSSHKVLFFILFCLGTFLVYPKESKWRTTGIGTRDTTRCSCVGIQTGADYELKNYCYGIPTSCKMSSEPIPKKAPFDTPLNNVNF